MPVHDLTTMMEDDNSSRGAEATSNPNNAADSSTKLPASTKSSLEAAEGAAASGGGGGDSKAAAGAGDEQQQQNETISLGGPVSTPCYALLDGVFQETDGTQTRVTIPITRLPATLGRTHDTDDPHFFGLGKKKQLSRKQCLIEYRVPSTSTTPDGDSKTNHDGRVEWDGAKQKLVYKDNKDKKSTSSNQGGEVSSDSSGGDIENIDPSDLPSTGYFAIGSLGKNRIMVNQERISQGKVAVLKSGTPIRISSYMLYFLLPTDVKPEIHVLPPDETQSSATSNKKRKALPADNEADNNNNKKPKATGGGGGGMQPELDALSVEELLDRFSNAIQSNEEWERKHQLVGSTIALHAVRSAALDPDIQIEATMVNTDPKSKDKNSGVSRTTIMNWIENSPKYGEWVQQMLTKIEPESYKASITKSLLKAGFTRTGTSGRYVKWLLPKDIMSTIKIKKSKSAAAAKTTAKAKSKPIASSNKMKEEVGGGKKSDDDDSAAASAGPKNDDQNDDDNEDDNEDEENDDEGGDMNNEEEEDDEAESENDEDDDDNEEEEEEEDNENENDDDDENDDENDDDDDSSSSELERPPGSAAATE